MFACISADQKKIVVVSDTRTRRNPRDERFYLQIEPGQFLDLLQLQEVLLGLEEDDDGHVADQHGARLLDNVDDFRLVDQLADEVEQRQQRRRPADQNGQDGIRRSPGDVQETNQQIAACVANVVDRGVTAMLEEKRYNSKRM